MKTLLVILVLAVPVYAGGKFTVTLGFTVTPGIEVVIPKPPPEPAPTTNIFADYPADRLRAALQPPAQPSRYTSPPGYHRHVATDGTVIEHSDSNNYKPVVTPAAHQNLVQSADGTWPQYTGPRAPTVRLPYATGYQPVLGVGYCPPNRP